MKEENKPEKMMLELFKVEMETQIKMLSEGLLSFQRAKEDLKILEPLMRAVHSIKGAAKVFSFEAIVQLAHAMEDFFVAAQAGKVILDEERSDFLFKTLDVLESLIHVPALEIPVKISGEQKKLETLVEEIKKIVPARKLSKQDAGEKTREKALLGIQETKKEREDLGVKEISAKKEFVQDNEDRILRLTAESINRLMGLAAESMVETRWLRPFCDSLINLKLIYNQMFAQLDFLKNSLGGYFLNDVINAHFLSLSHAMHAYNNQLSDHIADLEMFITRHSNLTDRLYSEVIESRMRPFADGVDAFPRMVWETARHLKKKVRLEILGKSTLIDRDILEKLEVPLGHLLRNAIVHGIETPEERIAAGKPPEGVIQLEATHKAGMLVILVADDGRGVDLKALQKNIIAKNLASESEVLNLNEQELLKVMLLPGFSTSEEITELTGRGMGLNIVQNMLQQVSGTLHIDNLPGKGITFLLQLPLTLSVIRALITRIDKGIFAFPLARIEQAVSVAKNQIEQVENREYFSYLGNNIGLVPAIQALSLGNYTPITSTLPIVILRDRSNYYGMVVDEFLGEKELVLQDIEAHLGKIPCISSGSVMENGDPILIVDIENIFEAIDTLLNTSQLHKIHYESEKPATRKKCILVVDDSISVREVECRLLKNQGYDVDWAVNGVDAWNMVRLKNYDLVVTDIDMPRMNGLELIRNIKNEARLKTLPVMVVSYKEKEHEKILALDAGANYYLAKSTFADAALINAVNDLIGEPEDHVL